MHQVVKGFISTHETLKNSIHSFNKVEKLSTNTFYKDLRHGITHYFAIVFSSQYE